MSSSRQLKPCYCEVCRVATTRTQWPWLQVAWVTRGNRWCVVEHEAKLNAVNHVHASACPPGDPSACPSPSFQASASTSDHRTRVSLLFRQRTKRRCCFLDPPFPSPWHRP